MVDTRSAGISTLHITRGGRTRKLTSARTAGPASGACGVRRRISRNSLTTLEQLLDPGHLGARGSDGETCLCSKQGLDLVLDELRVRGVEARPGHVTPQGRNHAEAGAGNVCRFGLAVLCREE